MYILYPSDKFRRKVRKLIKNNFLLNIKLQKTLVLLEKDPFYSSLQSHRVIAIQYGICQSSRVTGDIRILWRQNKEEVQVLDILDIGGHSGKNKVY